MSQNPIARETALLELLIQRAPDLRRAGVFIVELGDLKFQLTPFDPADTRAGHQQTLAPPPADPLDDPAAYPNGIVPGFGAPTNDD